MFNLKTLKRASKVRNVWLNLFAHVDINYYDPNFKSLLCLFSFLATQLRKYSLVLYSCKYENQTKKSVKFWEKIQQLWLIIWVFCANKTKHFNDYIVISNSIHLCSCRACSLQSLLKDKFLQKKMKIMQLSIAHNSY